MDEQPWRFQFSLKAILLTVVAVAVLLQGGRGFLFILNEVRHRGMKAGMASGYYPHDCKRCGAIIDDMLEFLNGGGFCRECDSLPVEAPSVESD